MKALRFRVDGQKMALDSQGNDEIIKGSRKLFQAVFSCNNDWSGCRLAAEFDSSSGAHEYVLVNNARCYIPESVLDDSRYTVRLIGVRSDGYRIVTNKELIYQGE